MYKQVKDKSSIQCTETCFNLGVRLDEEDKKKTAVLSHSHTTNTIESEKETN